MDSVAHILWTRTCALWTQDLVDSDSGPMESDSDSTLADSDLACIDRTHKKVSHVQTRSNTGCDV